MNQKQLAAKKAIEYVKPGMTLGLGTGSTVSFFIKELAVKVKEGLKIKAVSTSNSTTRLAVSLGIHVLDMNEIDKIDLTVDGADEVNENLNGIKGGGGALLYEKIVAKNSKTNIWIVDSTKFVNKLGDFPLPVEVVPYGSKHTFNKLQSSGYNPTFRMNGNDYFLSDGNHYIIDLHLNMIGDAESLDRELITITGIVETGLFLNICDTLIVGENGHCKIINKKKPEL